MASMDACMDKLEKDGQQMFREFTFNLEKARQRLSKCEKNKTDRRFYDRRQWNL